MSPHSPSMKLFGRKRHSSAPSPIIPQNPDSSSAPSTKSQSSTGLTSPEPSHSKTKQKAVKKAPDSYEMVKRRVKIQLAIIERPLMTDTEFLVDIRYRSVKYIGAGAYGIVVSAVDTVTDTRVAIKKILTAFNHSRMARHVLREVRLLRHLRHPNIVRLLDIDVPQQYRAWDSVYIVTTLLQYDLKTALTKGLIKTPLQQKKVAFQMMLALEHMHSLGIMHRDVKSRNLLLDKDLNVQLCDLGESRFYSKANRDIVDETGDASPVTEPELTGVITTMILSAPELSLGAEYDAKVDIWAAGCVIAEMLHPQHKYLFDCTSKQSHVQEIVNIVGFPTPDILEVLPDFGAWYLKILRKPKTEGSRIKELLGPTVDPVAIDLLEQMLRFSPKQRLSAKRVIEHPWFDDVRKICRFEKETYDFALSEPPKKTSRTQLKNLVWEEVVAFHPEAPNLGVRK